MEAVQTYAEGPPTPESIWAILREVAKQQEENALQMKETDRKMQETDRIVKENAVQMKETDRKMQETDRQLKETDRIIKENAIQMQETDRQLKETDRKISKLGGRFGEMIEHMVKPNLVQKFRDLGFVFTKVYQDTTIKDEKNSIVTEVDFTLENGDKVMLVEVKSKPTVDDIKEHLERMEKVKRHASLRADTRSYLGAVAGMVINDNARNFALGQGFYVIEPSGETFAITPPPGKPREW